MDRSTNIAESARVLLAGLIDYAGLFPPAALSMPDAVINYATYRNSNYKWMLGRFIVHVNRLDEFAESARDFYTRDGEGGWKLSVLASEDIDETVRRVREFNEREAPYAVCDTLEIKTNTSGLAEKIARSVPRGEFIAFFEIPIGAPLADLVSTLAIHQRFAKIRTGGVTNNDFPTSEQITRFMRTCLAANVPFKATAGLHHPIRCDRPLTYEKNAEIGTMHGFLNVFLAAGFLRQGYKSGLVQELLQDEWAESFTFDDAGVLWRQEYFLNTMQLADLRRRHAISFGSCSFVEPISDLQEIGIL